MSSTERKYFVRRRSTLEVLEVVFVGIDLMDDVTLAHENGKIVKVMMDDFIRLDEYEEVPS